MVGVALEVKDLHSVALSGTQWHSVALSGLEVKDLRERPSEAIGVISGNTWQSLRAGATHGSQVKCATHGSTCAPRWSRSA